MIVDPMDEQTEHPPATPPFTPKERSLAALFSLVMIGVVLSPIVENGRDRPQDSFPLSYYPMFTTKRGATYNVTYLAASDAAGHRQGLSYRLAGSGGFNQVRRQIRKTARDGRADQLCACVAAKLAPRDGEPYIDLIDVHVLTGTFDIARYFSGDKMPVKEKIHATCSIEREVP